MKFANEHSAVGRKSMSAVSSIHGCCCCNTSVSVSENGLQETAQTRSDDRKCNGAANHGVSGAKSGMR
jgi:hypothetical protein